MNTPPIIRIDARDWTGDHRIRLVSLAARGLWLECLCIMRSAPRTGYLETSAGVPLPEVALARITGAQEADIAALMRELLAAGIPDIEAESGVWHCRRMSAEAAKAIKCGAAGRRGGGNPALKAEERKPMEKAARKAAKPDKEPKGEAASAVTEAVPFAALMSPEQSASPEFAAAWAQWIAFRRQKKNAIQENTARLQLAKLASYADIATQVAIIEQSIMQGWTGLFDLKPSSSSSMLRATATSSRPVMDQSADDFAGQIDAAMERSAVGK